MSGIYTELAKRRAEQSNGRGNQGSVLPLAGKPAVQKEQDKAVKKQGPDGKKPAPQQTRRRVKLSLAPALPDSEMVEKYTTHVEPSLVKKLQIEAVQKEINDYDVVRIALKEYFERNK
jgi:hypothetical protein